MKKIILLLLTVVLTHSLSAQNNIAKERKLGIDLHVVQHIGLNSWSSAGYVNEGFPTATLTELRGVCNRSIFRYLGAFLDGGIGIMPAPKMQSFSLDRMPMPHSGTQYYLREMLSESGSGSASAHFKMTFGLFGKIPANENLSIMPYLGVGFLTMEQRKYEMILKEQGSNTQYQTTYIWNYYKRDSYDDGGSAVLSRLNARLNFKYKISAKSNLLLGVEYTRFLNTLDFYGQYVNTFNANIERNFSVKGSKMNMLGLSVGISFM